MSGGLRFPNPHLNHFLHAASDRQANRTVAGGFDFNLDYDSGRHLRLNMLGIPSNIIGIFKALEQQLGLKLEPTTAKLNAMAIQRVKRVPAAN